METIKDYRKKIKKLNSKDESILNIQNERLTILLENNLINLSPLNDLDDGLQEVELILGNVLEEFYLTLEVYSIERNYVGGCDDMGCQEIIRENEIDEVEFIEVYDVYLNDTFEVTNEVKELIKKII